MRPIKYIVVHCTGGSQKETIKQLKAGFRARGWKNDGYHFVVHPDGSITALVPIENIANGVAGHNAKAIHISWIGGWESNQRKAVDNRTDEQKTALREKLTELQDMFPKAEILGHRDFSPDKNQNGIVDKYEWVKVCPCFDAREEYKNI